MVTILPRFDPGGEIGKSIGAGIGGGLEDVANRALLRRGVNSIKDEMETKRKAGEKLNPLDITLSLMDKVGTMPGGLQALGELAPAIHKEVARQNMIGSGGEGEGDPGSPGVVNSKKLPAGSVIEGKEEVTERRPDKELSTDEYFNAKFQENLARTQDVDQAAALTQSQMAARTQEQNRRVQENTASANFLNQKITENFPDGISAPFKNELSEQFLDRVKTTDPNAAWNELMPKYRAAQVQEESLQTASGSNRPAMFLGGESSRKENASTAIQAIADIDPEYAVGLVQNKLDWGPTEAASIVRPGTDNFKKFVGQVKDAPRESSYVRGAAAIPDTKRFDADTKKYVGDTSRKLEKFLREKFDPNKDSLQALRGDLSSKGYPDELYVETVKKVFPQGAKDPNLSRFNQNEFPKLSEPVVPGLQELFNSLFSGDFGATFQKYKEGKVRGKK